MQIISSITRPNIGDNLKGILTEPATTPYNLQLPSFTEQCSYVAIEMIENSVTGYKVALQETEDDVLLSERMLAEKTIDLITDSNILQFKKNSRKIFLEQYTVESMQNKLSEIIF